MGFKVIIDSPEIKFSACHFLKRPERCSRLHGHNYYVSIELNSDLDEDFFVEDFIRLKKNLKSIIKQMDHYVLIPKNASDLSIIENSEAVEIKTANKRYVFPRQDVIFLPIHSTTTELLAKYIHDKLKEIYQNKKIIVRLKESETTSAVYEE